MPRIERGLFGKYSVDDSVLNRGGVGMIHHTIDPSFVYKRYLSARNLPSRANLDRLIKIGRDVLISQKKKPGDTPESSVNWPLDMVLDGNGVVTGVVFPTIPSVLFHEPKTVRTLDFLVLARAKPPPAKGRVVLLLRMAEIMAFINARGLVHGDINAKNLAWTLHPDPIMYLIDCDGMLPQSPAPTTGVGAANWTDPRVVDKVVRAHDHYSDWYCLALAMYRGLLLTHGVLDKTSDGRWPGPSKIPPELNSELAHLIHRGLSNPLASPPQRPTPKEWVDALVRAYLPNGDFDEDALDILDTISAPKPTPGTHFTPVPPIKPKPTFPLPPLLPRRPVSPPQHAWPVPSPQPTQRRPPPLYPPPPSARQQQKKWPRPQPGGELRRDRP